MIKCKENKNPLRRNGTAQTDRRLPAFQQSYVQVDERGFAEWIVFAKEYAAMLHFFDPTNEKNGDWSIFFASDTTAVFGTLALQDVHTYKALIKKQIDFLKDEDNASKLSESKQSLHQLFSIALSFAKAVDDYFLLMPEKHPYASLIGNLVKTQLSPAIHRLLTYYKPCVLPNGAPEKNLLAASDLSGLKVLGKEVFAAEDIIATGLGRLWWMQHENWDTYYQNIVPNPSIFGTHADEFRQLNYAAHHNLFTGIFDSLLMGFSKMVSAAEKELSAALNQRNTHPPHYALFLAFLRLFRVAQEDMNGLTKRHLDFYYKDILCLKTKPAEPNYAHIITTLAKTTESLIMAKNTLLKAGKDSGGKDVSYGLDEETTFNKATVADLRAVYIGEKGDDDLGTKNEGRVFAAPVINSADGLGAKLKSDNNEWHPMANRMYSEGEVVSIEMPEAEIGFAIASHYLFLQEGQRTITLGLVTSNNAALVSADFSIWLTTEKEWYEVKETVTLSQGNLSGAPDNCFFISFTLSGDVPPVVNYHAGIHGNNFNVNVPVMKILLRHKSGQYFQYPAFRDIVLNKFQITVQVGSMSAYSQTGVKQLSVSTDNGPVDTSKPFMPFGPLPKRDNLLVIGCHEIFSKKNASIRINVEWAGLPSSVNDIQYNTLYAATKGSDSKYSYSAVTGNTPHYPKVKTEFLKEGMWIDADENNVNLSPIDIFNNVNARVSIYSSGINVNPKTITEYPNGQLHLDAKSVKGFMRWVLDGDFGHKKYLSDNTKFLVDKNKSDYTQKEVGIMPIEPYTPLIQSLYLSYKAISDIVNLAVNDPLSLAGNPASIIHLYPFGHLQQHPAVTNSTTHYLFPQLRQYYFDFGVEHKHQGEFYIGFKNVQPQSAVQVLFQVMDGTADPMLDIKDGHIRWSYLAGNAWINFSKQDINDRTRQLIQSGTIRFTIPENATTEHTLMPSGLLWIRAAVTDKVDGICKLISVQAQAALVSFRDNGNAGDFLEQVLPDGSISKLKEPLSSVKKIEQPFASFGGRPAEKGDDFYVRVSERLRHKARAITIWDYEHLVLEAFPLIHKVKCLNHTKSADGDYNEVLPGHVTVITIPNLQQRNDINPLKPYTSQELRAQVKEYLKARISCHVNLHVVNPDFEEVKMKLKLKLAKGYEDFTIYAAQLQQDITDFLSPWATGKGDISFGGMIHKSVLINFIEERPYVDYITEVAMAHYDADKKLVAADNDSIMGLYAKSVLVSVPPSQHEIEEITEEEEITIKECIEPTGKKLTGKRKRSKKNG